MSPAIGWLIHANGLPTELPRVVEALTDTDLSAAVDGHSLYLRSQGIDRIKKRVDAEWAAYELVRLISAALHLRVGPVFLEFQSVEALTDPLVIDRQSTPVRHNGTQELSVAKIMKAAQHRENVRSALLAYADGGADGLFKAYEALGYELMDTQRLDYAAGIGTREWLIQQGWVSEPEEGRFLETVLHYGRQSSAPTFAPASPIEAHRLVGKLLNNWIEHISPQ